MGKVSLTDNEQAALRKAIAGELKRGKVDQKTRDTLVNLMRKLKGGVDDRTIDSSLRKDADT